MQRHSGPLPTRCYIRHIEMLLYVTNALLGWAMDYCTVLDDFVAKNRELHKYELQDED